MPRYDQCDDTCTVDCATASSFMLTMEISSSHVLRDLLYGRSARTGE